MKAIKYILSTVLLITMVWSCTEDEFGDTDFLNSAVAPTNVAALFTITQDNTGLVSISPSADGAVQFEIKHGDGTEDPEIVKAGEKSDHTYGEGTYTVDIVAKGITGLSTSLAKELVVSFQAPKFGTDPIIENDAAVSKQVNVTVPDDAKFAMFFDVTFVEDGLETIVTGNVGESVSYPYANPGIVDIKVVLKGGAIETVEYVLEGFEVTEILQPLVKAPTPPTREDGDVISMFSEKYTQTTVDMFVTDWSVVELQEEVAIEDNQTLVYRELAYAGIITEAEPMDASEMEYFHVDVWSANVSTFKTKFVDFNGTGYNDGTDNIAFELEHDITEEGKWISFDIPLSDYEGVPFSDINQMVIAADPVGTVFLDNMYFYKAPTVFADLPITFDSSVEAFEPFLGAAFEITADPEDANNPVGKITNYGEESSWGWEGVSLKLDTPVDLSIVSTIVLDFYNDGATHDVLMKLEDTTSPDDNDGNPSIKEEVHVSVSNTGWSKLVFNFTSGLSYDSVVLFVDGNVKGIPGTFYFDNVVNEEYIVLPLTMDTPGQTFEPFLGAEFELATDPDDTTNSVGKITNYGAETSWGWEGISLKLDGWIDTSVKTSITLDFYNDGATHDILIKLEDTTSPLDGNNNPSVFEEVHATVSNTGWSELTFDFTSGLPYNSIVIFVDGNVKGIPGTFYFDNVMQPAN